ncbi:MAG: gliding motility-associated C-terminal domain-containing protein, partial [Bacteroidia bacterium]|nr:gliding motility-associated C-terminal domain-containing protein [Bacteroidia bacterium]
RCTSSLNDTTLLDTNFGNGLSQGTNYSYLVIAVFTDNAESYASNQVCTQLKRDVPVLINVDVTSTSTSTGSVFVRWIKPLLNSSTALDTIALPGPYQMKLSYYNGFATSTYTTIYSVTKPYFAAINQLSDTTFTQSGINTSDVAHTYKIDFYANAIFIGSAQRASSVFLTLLPGDNQMKLNWTQQVPWVNYKFRIWRKIPSSSVFVLRDSTTSLTYTDLNLVNGATYCYKVEAIGQYSDPSILRPLINYSQEACAKPIDLVAPCAPKLDLISDCQLPSLVLQWNNPNHSCADDVVKYNIYIAETDESALILKDSIKIVSDTIIAFDNLTSIAGCYAITAVDSFGNESLQSAKMCVDNCPEYELPNVITLNSDGVNDFFKPIKNKFVKDIDLKIYNRWGVLVFETTDPKIMWDGTLIKTKQLCVDGTYFYVCQVNEIRVKGIKQRYLKGFLQIFNK